MWKLRGQPVAILPNCQPLLAPEYHFPVMVLSNNGGYVMAPGNDAKACGITTGTPFL
ncbi:hypothetical protein [uncultured Pedobacter sp.]|uniref:hypothetical protein n=1 Tax=uncultured Pedobacter sp. TaxID=246139 RepID=UPI0025E0DCE9|nr:hypothetical protein [uncultured Pedobacter sp.]